MQMFHILGHFPINAHATSRTFIHTFPCLFQDLNPNIPNPIQGPSPIHSHAYSRTFTHTFPCLFKNLNPYIPMPLLGSLYIPIPFLFQDLNPYIPIPILGLSPIHSHVYSRTFTHTFSCLFQDLHPYIPTVLLCASNSFIYLSFNPSIGNKKEKQHILNSTIKNLNMYVCTELTFWRLRY